VAASDVTSLLRAWADGDAGALDRLAPAVHRELHRIARACMAAERTGHTLQPTALVNEAYLRLAGAPPVDWQNRSHFFAMSARLMRRILVDVARAKRSQKRGAAGATVSLDAAMSVAVQRSPDLVSVDLALDALAALDVRKSRVVELRFFGGYAVEEIADILGVSPKTVHRDWQFARSWLRRELRREAASGA
jgi:RNA polymerase sigma factor (TIGR02999 family)